MSETLTSKLDSLFNENMLSLLIETNSYTKTLTELTHFISKKFFGGDKLLLSSHPDILFIESSNRSINLAEVGQIESFMQTSSIYSGKKFVILQDVELINRFATHLLLTQIEQLKANHFIFLLTQNLPMILKSIYTRVFKIRNLYFDDMLNEQHISFFLNSQSVIDKIKLIQELANKENFAKWKDFIFNTELLLRRLLYESLFHSNNLSKIEEEIFYQFHNRSSVQFFRILHKTYHHFNKNIRYDLDIKSTMLTILHEFK